MEQSEPRQVAIVQLGRLGDIVSALPIAYILTRAGNDVHWYCCRQFADILEACPYLTVHALGPEIGVREVRKATAIAKAAGYDEIIVPQVDGNEAKCSVECDNFTLKQWALAGLDFLRQYHDYRPLFIPSDTIEADAAVDAVLPANDGRPLLLFNLAGHSSPYCHTTSMRKWIGETFSAQYRIADLSGVKFAKPHHLLSALRRAAVLITTDTLHLHLAYATMTPTVQLSAGKSPSGAGSAFYDSECRAQVIAKGSYADSISPAWRARISMMIGKQDFAPGRLVHPIDGSSMPVPVGGRTIWHVGDWYTGNVADNPRIYRARATWEELRRDPAYYHCFSEMHPKQRSSADLGDTRRLPYIKDIINHAPVGFAEDIIIFTNSDVCLVPEALHEIRRKMEGCECCFSRRIDVLDGAPRRRLSDLRKVAAHVGADLFAMTVEFWVSHRDELPDVFLSCEGWDWAARHWMLKYNPCAEMTPPIIWHQQHESYWARKDVIHSSPAQVHNRTVLAAWAKENGLEAGIYKTGSKFLFRPDGDWVAKPPRQLVAG